MTGLTEELMFPCNISSLSVVIILPIWHVARRDVAAETRTHLIDQFPWLFFQVLLPSLAMSSKCLLMCLNLLINWHVRHYPAFFVFHLQNWVSTLSRDHLVAKEPNICLALMRQPQPFLAFPGTQQIGQFRFGLKNTSKWTSCSTHKKVGQGDESGGNIIPNGLGVEFWRPHPIKNCADSLLLNEPEPEVPLTGIASLSSLPASGALPPA